MCTPINHSPFVVLTSFLFSDVSTFLVPDDFRNYLKSIRIDNMNKLIFAHSNIYSLRNKFDLLSKQIKGSMVHTDDI